MISDHWMPDAACVGLGRLFDDSDTEVLLDEARRVCQLCAVRQDCLDFAMHTSQQHGVWGGLTSDERHQVLVGLTR